MIIKKITAYYREEPLQLKTFVDKDGGISVVKDGVKNYNGVLCPRFTLNIHEINRNEDKYRIKDLTDLLEILSQSNHIIGWQKN